MTRRGHPAYGRARAYRLTCVGSGSLGPGHSSADAHEGNAPRENLDAVLAPLETPSTTPAPSPWALGIIARSQNMSEIARRVGMSRGERRCWGGEGLAVGGHQVARVGLVPSAPSGTCAYRRHEDPALPSDPWSIEMNGRAPPAVVCRWKCSGGSGHAGTRTRCPIGARTSPRRSCSRLPDSTSTSDQAPPDDRHDELPWGSLEGGKHLADEKVERLLLLLVREAVVAPEAELVDAHLLVVPEPLDDFIGGTDHRGLVQ